MKARIGTIGLIFALIFANQVSAGMVSIGSGRDTSIYGNAVNNSNGSGVEMVTGNDNSSNPRRGLVWFDVAANVPAGATITSVTLTMHLVTSASMGPATTDVVLYRLLADWGEGASDPDTGPGTGTGTGAATGDATWNMRFFNTVAWGTAGGDFNGTASATQTINKTNGAKTWQSAAMVSDVQLWLDNSATNFGWIVGPATADVTSRTERRFATREADEELIPTLTLEFTEAVPEPAAWVLAAVGLAVLGAGVMRRRIWNH